MDNESITHEPSSLLRFFTTEHEAQRFLEGEIRFGLLAHYKAIEGARRDEKEGESTFYWDTPAPKLIIDLSSGKIIGRGESDQKIHSSGCSMNARYILCTSHPDVDVPKLKVRFGPFVVRIEKPLVLMYKIKEQWQAHPLSSVGTTELKEVVYNKGELLKPNPYLMAPYDYDYIQKPRTFNDEREYRYVLTCRLDKDLVFPENITLQVAGCDEICSLATPSIA